MPIGFAHAREENEVNIYEGDLEAQSDAITSIQPGPGVMMHEFGYRFTDMYWRQTEGLGVGRYTN